MRLMIAVTIALLLGGLPVFAQAATSEIRCTGQTSIVKEGTPGLLKVPASDGSEGKYYVLAAVHDPALRNFTGVWEKSPRAPAAEQDVLRYEPVRCSRIAAGGIVAEKWTEVHADYLVMGVANLTSTKP